MAEYLLGEDDKKRFKEVSNELSTKNKEKVSELCKKGRVTVYDIDELGKEVMDTLPLFAFFSTLKIAKRQVEQYQASDAFKAKTRQLRIQQENREYKEIVKDVDPLQKYGQSALVENFGSELRSVNRQLMSVFNVVITVVCGFFFGFSGITYLYPHLKIDLSVRFMFGLVCATIIFFADLYFLMKGMDDDITEQERLVAASRATTVKRSTVITPSEPPSEEVHVPSETTNDSNSVQKRKKPKKTN